MYLDNVLAYNLVAYLLEMKRKLDSGGKEEKDSVGNRSLLPCVHFGTVMDHACIFSAEGTFIQLTKYVIEGQDVCYLAQHHGSYH